MPKPTLKSILPEYLLGLTTGLAAGLWTQLYFLSHDSTCLAFAILFGAASVIMLGYLLKGLL